jgi:nucleoside-diphosphate-sugar epimerase
MPLALALRNRAGVRLVVSSPQRLQELSNAGYDCVLPDWQNGPIALSDVVVVTLPPMFGKSEHARHALVAKALHEQQPRQAIVISSTGVYGKTTGSCTEADADALHPLFALEQLYLSASSNVCILRFGGLFGEGRHPSRFFGEKPIPNPDEPVNMTPQTDAVRSILFALENDLQGIYNAVHPDHPSRREFYSEAYTAVGRSARFSEDVGSVGKVVNSSKLIQKGFAFTPQALHFK